MSNNKKCLCDYEDKYIEAIRKSKESADRLKTALKERENLENSLASLAGELK